MDEPARPPSCAELLRAAVAEAGGWEALAARVPTVNGRTRPSFARLKQMAGKDGVKRISGPDTLDGLTAACAGLPSALEAHPMDNPYRLDAWIAAQRETLRRAGLEGTGIPAPVPDLPRPRQRTLLEREVTAVLGEVDTSGLRPDQVDAVTGLIRHLAGGARARRGA